MCQCLNIEHFDVAHHLHDPLDDHGVVHRNGAAIEGKMRMKPSAPPRYNALKHKLLAEGVTELDSPGTFRKFFLRLQNELQPVGELEKALVQRVALCLVRLRRAAMMEAEFVTEHLNPVIRETPADRLGQLGEMLQGKTIIKEQGRPARLSPAAVGTMLLTFQRYETAAEAKLYRALNQIERLQQRREASLLGAETRKGNPKQRQRRRSECGSLKKSNADAFRTGNRNF